METSQIKNFAQSLRNQLRDGVKQRLLYWGFNEKGEVNERPEAVEGGYMFRGNVFDDNTVPNRWKQLKRMIDLHSIDYVIEEGAYTWFNRLMAIRILEKNDYIQPQLEYEEGTQLPYLLQNARRGIFPDMKDNELTQVKKQLRENKDNKAFARLLTHFCDTQPLISKVFGKISYSNDYTELLLPQNLLDQEGILDFIVTTNAITDKDFEQVELIGWLYQYYISEKKDEVFKSFNRNEKAAPGDIPAATGIFTPIWIVHYMVENTVGKLWMDLHPDSPVQDRFEYFVEPAEENPKAEPIIEDVTDLTLLDPAAGSGHILVVGFEHLMEMYREEGYTARQAIEGILENNLYGLEIDERAAQLARFAVLLKAAKYDQSALDGDKLPHIHSFPERTHISTAEIREFLGSEGEQYVEEFKDAVQILQEGKNLGSTIQLQVSKKGVEFFKKRVEELKPIGIENLSIKQLLYKVKPLVDVIYMLQKKYKAVAANPPYMGSRNMNSRLKEHLKDNYPNLKKDLSAAFLDVLIRFGDDGAKRGIINQWAWMCISSYAEFRERFLTNYDSNSILFLGIGVFGDLNTKKVQNASLIFEEKKHRNYKTKCFKLDHTFKNKRKKELFLERDCREVNLTKLLKIPGAPLAFWLNDQIINNYSQGDVLKNYLKPRQGLATRDNDRFVRFWYELNIDNISYGSDNRKEALKSNKKWFPYNKGGGFRRWYGNEFFVVNWENDGKEIKEYSEEKYKNYSRTVKNEKYYFEEGITWSQISLDFSARFSTKGHIFDVCGSSGFPPKKLLFYSLALLNSKVSSYLLSALNFTLNVQVGDIKRILYLRPGKYLEPIDRKTKKIVSLAKKEFDSSEISKDFSKHNFLKINGDQLKEVIDKYFAQVIENINEYYRLEKEINRDLIQLYKLNNDLNENPKLNNIKLYSSIVSDLEAILNYENRKVEYHKLFDIGSSLKSLISYAIGCMMGRYRLDKTGLYIANSKNSDSLDFSYDFNDNVWSIDDDGLIPVIGKKSSFSDDIVYRTEKFIEVVWGAENLTSNLNYLQNYFKNGVEEFLLNEFWDFHKKKYDKCPIYWLFSSKNGAFKVLAYMHRMDKYTVQKVRQNYLHPHMDYLRNEIDKLEGRDSLNSDESKQLDTYRANLNECLEYDEVIKEVADKQIDFDLDDGVKNNYELFGKALAKI